MENLKSDLIELSFSKIQAYQRCPWLYHLVFIDAWREGPNASQALGSSLHQTLAAFHARDNSDKSLERLMEIYDENWINEGYESPEIALSTYAFGKALLEKFFQSDRDNRNEVIGTEVDFSLPLPGVSFRGTIDRLDRATDGRTIIIEYKSNPVGWTEENLKNHLQMTLYQIGVEEGLGLTPTELRYYFFHTAEWKFTQRTAQQRGEAKRTILGVAERIRNKDFRPKIEYCIHCQFKHRCPNAKINNL